MLFENINQFEKAKNMLIESEGDINKAFDKLKKIPSFSNLSERELLSALEDLNEGLGDKILNFLGGSFGGDISKLKTVLTQMKEQELKFNQEEFEIYNQFYSLLQDQKALDKDKGNPDYQNLSKDIAQSRGSLNTRMKELTKTHDEIFNALEDKVKSLVGDNKRKKKYFNAERATNVLETKNDRYEKIKAITAKSSSRSKELEDFFGVTTEDAKKEAEDAKIKANAAVSAMSQTTPQSKKNISFNEEPEKNFNKRFEEIKNKNIIFTKKENELEELVKDLEDIISSSAYKTYSAEKQQKMHIIYNNVQLYIAYRV